MCLPQYVKMFDPVHKKEKEIPDEENTENSDNEGYRDE